MGPYALHRNRRYSLSIALIHPVVANWAARVIAHGGAAPSDNTKLALSEFYSSLESSGLNALFKSLCCFVPDNLIAAITPLIASYGNDPWVNHNFVIGDLTSAGLIGNGSTKYLDSGVISSTAFSADTSGGLTCYISVANNATTNIDMGANNPSNFIEFVTGDGGKVDWDCYNNTAGQGRAQATLGATAGYFSGDRTASNASSLYFANSSNAHSALVSIVTTGGARVTTYPIFVFGNNNHALGLQLPSNNRLSFSAIHEGLTSAQSTTLFGLVQAMRVSLGGGFV